MLDFEYAKTISQNNPGALTFLMDALSPTRKLSELVRNEIAINKMKENNILGEKLYMLWNDCCDRDTTKTIDVIYTHSIEDIIEHINFENGRGIPF